MNKKYYVVWKGHSPGIYDSWEECKLQITGFPGAEYKSFSSQDAATEAYRGDYNEQISLIKSIANHQREIVNYEAIPEIVKNSISVDGACSKNPGPMEYRCVDVMTGAEIFHVGPLEDGTNNVAEYLALIHALAFLKSTGNTETVVYSDSRTAMSWIKNRGNKSKLERTSKNEKIFELLARADKWIQSNVSYNLVLKWDTEKWGEIPADFNRK